jgi:hypothetical protein
MNLNLFGRRRPSQSAPPGPSPTARNGRSPNNKQGNSKSNKSDTIDSLTKMRDTVRDLEKRENFLGVKANAQLEEATTKNRAGDKKGAIAAMTRKKMFEQEGECIFRFF